MEEAGFDWRGHEGMFWGEGKVLHLDCGVGSISVTFVKTHWIDYLRSVQFTVCKFYIKKSISLSKREITFTPRLLSVEFLIKNITIRNFKKMPRQYSLAWVLYTILFSVDCESDFCELKSWRSNLLNNLGRATTLLCASVSSSVKWR